MARSDAAVEVPMAELQDHLGGRPVCRFGSTVLIHEALLHELLTLVAVLVAAPLTIVAVYAVGHDEVLDDERGFAPGTIPERLAESREVLRFGGRHVVVLFEIAHLLLRRRGVAAGTQEGGRLRCRAVADGAQAVE